MVVCKCRTGDGQASADPHRRRRRERTVGSVPSVRDGTLAAWVALTAQAAATITDFVLCTVANAASGSPDYWPAAGGRRSAARWRSHRMRARLPAGMDA